MLKMRLQRIGRKNDASFRLIVTDSRRGPKSGKHIDLLGSYNPKQNEFTVNKEKIVDWISKGAQVSDTVHNLLVSKKIIEGKKRNVLPKKSPVVDEEALKRQQEEEEAKKAAEAAAAAEAETPAEETPATEEAPAEEAPAAEETTEEKKEG